MPKVPGMTGWITSYDVQRNGDVVLWIHDPDEATTLPVLVKRVELETIAAASAAKRA